jgi:GDP-L-fucose synthase
MKQRFVVTGSTGFLGRHLMPVLQKCYPNDIVIGLSSKDYNLMDPYQVHKLFEDQNVDVLIHLAAYSGGIGANKQFPADFYYRNTLLTALVFQEAALHHVKKLLYPMGGCAYPADAKSPIDEEQMWKGFPQMESAGYSSAKKMGIVASMSYRQQYGLNSAVLIPGNMYGEYDNFRSNESHVVPAMVRRYFEMQNQSADEIVMWGTGEPVRDFVYAGDVAAVFPYFIENYDSSEPVNISSGTTTSIRELAETIGELVHFRGKITWDTSKPNGQMIKIFDVKRMLGLGLQCPTSLYAGLENTIRWLTTNYANRSDGIRL